MDTSYVEQGSTGIDPSEHALKVTTFRPLVNIKTRNFFAYSYKVLARNKSPNSESLIHWVTGAPEHIQSKIEEVKSLHFDLSAMHSDMELAAKDGDKGTMRRLKREIVNITAKIDEVCYPLEERQKVETAQSKLLKQEKSNSVEVSISPASPIAATVVAPPVAPVVQTRQQKAAQTRKQNKLKQIEADNKRTEEQALLDKNPDPTENFEMVEPE